MNRTSACSDMDDRIVPVYVFRHPGFAPTGDTVMAVAPLEWVVAAYGGGGIAGEGGLSTVFGGAAVFENEDTGERFAGVWGARKASRLRTRLRASIRIDIVGHAPAGRLTFYSTENRQPKKRAKAVTTAD